MSGNPLDQLVSLTDPEGCHVTNLPSRIWVLGGTFEDSSNGPALSFRHAFWRRTLTAQRPAWLRDLIRPEDMAGWLEHSGYTDLLEFERDACYLARATILFAESPGSHAELGCIGIDESLSRRLVVVVEQKYRAEAQKNSFLSLGPLRRAEHDGLLCVIDPDVDFNLPEADYEAIIESLQSWLPTQPKREKFNPQNRAHIFLLIADLADVLLIATETDLIEATKHFGVSIRPDDFRKFLGMLKFLGLIRLYEYGAAKYWLREGGNGPWIDYKSSDGKVPFDRVRFKVKASVTLAEDRRLKAIYERARK